MNLSEHQSPFADPLVDFRNQAMHLRVGFVVRCTATKMANGSDCKSDVCAFDSRAVLIGGGE